MGRIMNADNPPTMDGIEYFGYIVKTIGLFGTSVVLYIALKDNVSFLGSHKEIEVEYIFAIFTVLAIPTFLYTYLNAPKPLTEEADNKKI